ncbi:MAG: hypothetical protein AB1298_07345 [Bacteroidota bacterium]
MTLVLVNFCAMKKIFRYNVIKNLSALLLAAIVFVFIHSELLQFCYKTETRETHDYCQIVDGATIHVGKNIFTKSFELHVNKSNDNTWTDFYTNLLQKFNYNFLPEKHSITTGIYLHNSTFLI